MGLCADESQPKIEALKVLNEYLVDRTTLGGTKVTEADKLIFDSLHSSYSTLTFSEKEAYIHLSRWFAYLQDLDEVSQNRQKIVFSRTQLYK